MTTPSVVTVGNFDGVHVGHQAIFHRAAALAADRGQAVIALTFEPHPASVLRPGTQPPRLMTRNQRIEAILRAGADQVELLAPTAELLSLDPKAFVDWLVQTYHPRVVVEGANFRFGKGRAGDVNQLKALGQARGFDVEILDQLTVPMQDQTIAPVSSSLVRWLLAHGRVTDAARCLGRPYRLSGQVVTGQRRGASLGVPTANLDWQSPIADNNDHDSAPLILPANGVYAGFAILAEGAQHSAAISIGTQPTFQGKARTVEAHLLDFQGDLYGQTISLDFTRWIRDQQAFPNVHALRDQLSCDIRHARAAAAAASRCYSPA